MVGQPFKAGIWSRGLKPSATLSRHSVTTLHSNPPIFRQHLTIFHASAVRNEATSKLRPDKTSTTVWPAKCAG